MYIWTQTADNKFQLSKEDQSLLQMELHYNSNNQAALYEVDGQSFQIIKKGFWKNQTEILDTNKIPILSVNPKNWYSNIFILDYEGNTYELKIENKPLAHWNIYKNDQLIFSYGLNFSDNKLRIAISDNVNNLHFHALLWQLFWPVAQENFGQNLVFS